MNKNIIPKTMGERIKALREKKGMTQKALADKLGTQRETVSEWESNKEGRYINTDRIILMADIFDVTCEYIIRGTEPENETISDNFELHNEAINSIKLSTDIVRQSSQSVLKMSTEIVHRDNQNDEKLNELISKLFAKSGATDEEEFRSRIIQYAENTVDFANLLLKERFSHNSLRDLDYLMDYIRDGSNESKDSASRENLSDLDARALRLLKAQQALDRLRLNYKKKR